MTATRRLAAILAADVAGYSRLMGADEEGTLDRLKACRRELIDLKIAEHASKTFNPPSATFSRSRRGLRPNKASLRLPGPR